MMLALMRVKRAVFSALLVATAGLTSAAQAPMPPGAATLFEGARLIAGNGGPPIDDSAFIVEGRLVHTGWTAGRAAAAAGRPHGWICPARRSSPALVDAHSHIGYMKHLTSGPQNYTRENILDHMRRFAYFGVVASQAMGSDFGELPFQLRDETLAGNIPTPPVSSPQGEAWRRSGDQPDNMRQAALP